MEKKCKLVCGIGFNDGKYPAFICGRSIDEYRAWSDMLVRCTDKTWNRCPTYIGTTCSDNFKSYSFFYEWYHKQHNHDRIDEDGRKWCLDKDLLSVGGKVYSEDTCVFIPQRINKLLTKSNSARGEYPIGVSLKKSSNKYVANCRGLGGKYLHLGLFTDVTEAFLAYKTFKESFIKGVANKYKEILDNRAYNALMKYEVNEND